MQLFRRHDGLDEEGRVVDPWEMPPVWLHHEPGVGEDLGEQARFLRPRARIQLAGVNEHGRGDAAQVPAYSLDIWLKRKILGGGLVAALGLVGSRVGAGGLTERAAVEKRDNGAASP